MFISSADIVQVDCSVQASKQTNRQCYRTRKLQFAGVKITFKFKSACLHLSCLLEQKQEKTQEKKNKDHIAHLIKNVLLCIRNIIKPKCNNNNNNNNNNVCLAYTKDF